MPKMHLDKDAINLKYDHFFAPANKLLDSLVVQVKKNILLLFDGTI